MHYFSNKIHFRNASFFVYSKSVLNTVNKWYVNRFGITFSIMQN